MKIYFQEKKMYNIIVRIKRKQGSIRLSASLSCIERVGEEM